MSLLPRRSFLSLCASQVGTRTIRRGIASSSNRPAVVAESSEAVAASGSTSASGSSTAEAPPLRQSIYGSKELLEAKRARKLAQYEKLLTAKALEEGFSSVEEMRAKQEQEKARTAETSEKESEAKLKAAGMTEVDAKVAGEIRKRAEAEAKRKIESGNFSSGPGIKSLSDIIDIARLESDSPAKISQLWTQYHSLKNRISAVIPAKQYAQMTQNARKYPQFLLPLPRTIVGSLEGDQNETANVAPGEKKQGYEMLYMQWSFLPPPPAMPFADTPDESVSFSQEERQIIQRASPTTVLYTPLAEYKLRQEYAQPVLVLTHYTDLALSKGIVLLRGEVTGAEEAAAAPTGIAAATAASQAGETSQEKLEQLKKPLQSQGRLSPQDAQLLTVTLQRFYMPKMDESAETSTTPGEVERRELLDAFHNNHDKFDIDRLCTYSLMT